MDYEYGLKRLTRPENTPYRLSGAQEEKVSSIITPELKEIAHFYSNHILVANFEKSQRDFILDEYDLNQWKVHPSSTTNVSILVKKTDPQQIVITIYFEKELVIHGDVKLSSQYKSCSEIIKKFKNSIFARLVGFKLGGIIAHELGKHFRIKSYVFNPTNWVNQVSLKDHVVFATRDSDSVNSTPFTFIPKPELHSDSIHHFRQ